MRTGQRRSAILQQLLRTGYVEARQLAADFDVDSSTIRRDLDELARRGHLDRTHGGARVRSGAVDIPYASKEREQLPAKAAIAAHAASLICDGDSVLLDSGSTTHELARALSDRRDLTIVTNDLRIARLVADYRGIHLLVAGGELLPTTFTLAGELAARYIEDLRLDWAFLGADAIDLKSGVTNTNTIEIRFKRNFIQAGRTVAVLADSTKFDRTALVRVADLAEIDMVITDSALSEEQASRYGKRVVCAAPLEPSAPQDRTAP